MIEINLLPKRRQLKLPTVAGLDLKNINVKWMLVVAALYYLPGYVTEPMWDKNIEESRVNLKSAKKKVKKLNQDLGNHASLKKQLDDFNNQVKKMRLREKIVAEVLKEKINPFKPLFFLVKNIPADLWWESLILKNGRVSIDGGSLSYKSIGDFILSANDSIYFGGSFVLKDSKTKQDKGKTKSKKRVEVYKLSAKIKRYE